MSQLFPLFAMYWAFFWLVVIRLSQTIDKKQSRVKTENIIKLIFKIFFWIYVYYESAGTIKQISTYRPGDPEIYNLLNGRSEVLTDYS